MSSKKTNSTGKPKATGRPAGRAKTSKKPVTIDLDAEEVSGANETDRSNKKSQETGEPKLGRQEAATAPSTPHKQGGLMGKLAAAIIGGIVALGGAGGLQYLDIWPATNTDQNKVASVEALESTRNDLIAQIADLNARLSEQSSQPGPAFDEATLNTVIDERIKDAPSSQQAAETAAQMELLQGLLTDMDTRMAALQEAADKTRQDITGLETAASATNNEAATTTLLQQVETLAKDLDDVKQSAVTTMVEQVETLNKELDTLKQDVSRNTRSADGGPTQNAVIATLIEQIETLSSEVEGVKKVAETAGNGTLQSTQSAIAALQAALPALKKEISGGIDSRLEETAGSFAEQAKALEDRVDGVEKQSNTYVNLPERIAALETELGSIAGQIAGQKSALDELQTKANDGSQEKAARAIAAAALKSDIDRGIPFAQSLANLKSLADKPDELAALDLFSETGVPTAEALSTGFTLLEDGLIEAITPKAGDDLASRLAAGAKSLVKVRPINPESGDGPVALVSLISKKLEDGKLTEASELWSQLPEAGQTLSREWHDGLQARLLANTLVAKTVQSYLSSSGQ